MRNAFYLLMICRMVNVVGEQGTYWVANNFIWGWLLLPVLSLGELIKREVAQEGHVTRAAMKRYGIVTGIICALWIVAVPAYKPFMKYVLRFDDVDKLFRLVMLLLIFYMMFAFQNICDSVFYGLGKTEYMLFESVVTNVIYYGAAFILYRAGIFHPTLQGIALMFGLGIAFDSVVSRLAFRHLTGI